jgi:hypothetical protein
MKGYIAPIAFVVGASLGTSVTWFVLKNKFEKDMAVELESVVNEFSKEPRVIFKERVTPQHPAKEIKIDEPSVEVKKYIDYTKPYIDPELAESELTDEEKAEGPDEDDDEDDEDDFFDEDDDSQYDLVLEKQEPANGYRKPYPVTPEEFADILLEEYTLIEWVIYNGKQGNRVLVNENDEAVTQEDLHNMIGTCLYCVGQYEDGIGYVRNDRLRCAIEITEDLRNYSDVLKSMPFIKF